MEALFKNSIPKKEQKTHISGIGENGVWKGANPLLV
jgi:hypothetical protein